MKQDISHKIRKNSSYRMSYFFLSSARNSNEFANKKSAFSGVQSLKYSFRAP